MVKRLPRLTLTQIPSIGDLLVSQSVPLVGLALVGFYISAVLGPKGKGLAALALTLGSLGGSLLFLSLHVLVVEAHHRGEGGLLVRATAVTVVLGTLPLAACWAVGVARIGYGVSERRTLIFLGLAAIPVEAPALVVMRAIQGVGDARHYRTGSLLRVGVYGGLIAVLSVIRLTPVRVLWAYILADVVLLVYALAVSHAVLTVPGSMGQRTRLTWRRLSMGLTAHLAVVSQQASYRADIVLLGFLARAPVVGQYVFATSIAEVLWFVAEATSLAVYAETARLGGSGPDEHSATLSRGIRGYLEIACIAAALVIVGSYGAIRVLFPAFRAAYPLILILLPGILIGGLARMITYSAIASGHTRILRVGAVTALTLTPLYLPLVVLAGATGAAIASDIIYVLMAGVLFYYQRRPGARALPVSG